MKTAVHILTTVRSAALLPAALLVFRTLRVGFPAAEVKVWGNGLEGNAEAAVRSAAASVGAWFGNLQPTSHDLWVEGLLEQELGAFWIVDTDVVFWGAMAARAEGEVLAGRFEPEFMEAWTGTRHMARLHTAVMWLNAPRLRAEIRKWMAGVPAPWGHSGEFALMRQHFVPLRRAAAGPTEMLFYDTCAGVWHAVGGTSFSAEEDAQFSHLHCATYVDVMQGGPGPGKGLAKLHELVYQDSGMARGILATQMEYYRKQAPRWPLTKTSAKKGTI